MEDRIVTDHLLEEEQQTEGTLRPQTLDDYTGQARMKESLRVCIEAAQGRGEPLDHAIFYGPPGLGKTTIAHVIAREMGGGIRSTSGLVLNHAGDLAALLPYARPLFLIATLCLIFELPFNIYSGALRGAGDTTYPMVVNIGVAWLVFVPLVFFATRNWGLGGAWSCFIVHVALLAGLLAVRVRGRTWIERGASLLDAERAGGVATSSVSEMDDLRSSPAL